VLLAAASLGPVAVFVALSFYWYPRYILFATVPFLVLAARVLTFVAQRAARMTGHAAPWLAALLAAVLVPAVRFDAALLENPATAPLPRLERFQYVDGFSSGYGCAEAVAWFRNALSAHPEGITVAAETPGRRTLFLCLRTSFMNEPRVEMRGVDPSTPQGRDMLLARARVRPTFLVTGSKEEAGTRFEPLSAVRLAQWRKPSGVLAGELYQVGVR
jgi:hypothetical protein